MPRSNSPEPKYNTLKPRRRKHRQSQFYSLRLCRKHEAAHRNFQVYAIPIYKSCPHKNGSTSTIATSVRSGECTPTSTLTRSSRETIKSEIIKTETIKTETIKSERTNSVSFNLECVSSERINSEVTKSTRKMTTTTTIPPIPAPRTRKTNPIEHTYQNIPPPVFPEKSTTATKLKVCRPLILFTAPSRSDTRKYCDRKVVLELFTSHLYSVLAFISRLPGCAFPRRSLHAKLSVHYHQTCSNIRGTPVAW